MSETLIALLSNTAMVDASYAGFAARMAAAEAAEAASVASLNARMTLWSGAAVDTGVTARPMKGAA
jgi:hypothetical protein